LIEHIEGVNILAVYGGQDVESQLKKLKKNIHIVIGTPGRLLDHIRRETVDFSKAAFLVLDEADQMLHIGFLDEVEEIIKQTPKTRQTLLFSATMPDEIRKLAKHHMYKPENIQIEKTQAPLANIKQIAISTVDRAKQNDLMESLRVYQPFLGVIFCRTKRRVSKLNDALKANNFNCDELHGDLSQAKREQVMKKFREAKIQYLIATDVAARGLDVEGVTHVFNYDMPLDTESYIHRIGRTGRAGNEGIAVTFYSPKDKPLLEMIESDLKLRIEKKNFGNARSAEAGEDDPADNRRSGNRIENRSSSNRDRRNEDYKGKNTRSKRSTSGSQDRIGRSGNVERDHRGEKITTDRFSRGDSRENRSRTGEDPARRSRDERPRKPNERREPNRADRNREQDRPQRDTNSRSSRLSGERRESSRRNEEYGSGQRSVSNENRDATPRFERKSGERPSAQGRSDSDRKGKQPSVHGERRNKGINKKSGAQNRRSK
ncbi:MAG: helicase-related protein, partial [Mesobacillus sp.]|uniref:DEAD/DEAH box helicase n=1 Tax=Mesobacillus sp. TaxID=2675271 RepID=UPI003C659BC8